MNKLLFVCNDGNNVVHVDVCAFFLFKLFKMDFTRNGMDCFDTRIQTGELTNLQMVTHNSRAMSNYKPLTRPTQNSSMNDRFDLT